MTVVPREKRHGGITLLGDGLTYKKKGSLEEEEGEKSAPTALQTAKGKAFFFNSEGGGTDEEGLP